MQLRKLPISKRQPVANAANSGADSSDSDGTVQLSDVLPSPTWSRMSRRRQRAYTDIDMTALGRSRSEITVDAHSRACEKFDIEMTVDAHSRACEKSSVDNVSAEEVLLTFVLQEV